LPNPNEISLLHQIGNLVHEWLERKANAVAAARMEKKKEFHFDMNLIQVGGGGMTFPFK